jgi:hypothetical protein
MRSPAWSGKICAFSTMLIPCHTEATEKREEQKHMLHEPRFNSLFRKHWYFLNLYELCVLGGE